jgi:hypothetical protein
VRTRLIPLLVVQDPVSAQGLILGHPHRTDTPQESCSKLLISPHRLPIRINSKNNNNWSWEGHDSMMNISEWSYNRDTMSRAVVFSPQPLHHIMSFILIQVVPSCRAWNLVAFGMPPLRLATSLSFFLHNFSEIHILQGHETETAWSDSEVRSKIVLRCVLM